MVDFIDEVNEELRRERLTRFWEKMGRYIIGVSVVIVGITVASVLWENYKASRQQDAAGAYLTAEKARVQKQLDQAAGAFADLAKDDATGYPALARMKEAAILREQGKNEEAVAAYVALADERTADAGLRAFARIYAAQLMSLSGKPLAEVEAVLKPLTEKADSPFAALAKEQLALAAHTAGDDAKARALFEEISAAQKASSSLRQRASAQAGLLAPAQDGSNQAAAE